MKSIPSPRPRVKPSRTCRLHGDGGTMLLSLTVGAKSDDYFLTAHEAPGTYRLRKPLPDGSTYDVDLTAGSCECLGALRWGHRHPCKHISSLLALRAAGKLVA